MKDKSLKVSEAITVGAFTGKKGSKGKLKPWISIIFDSEYQSPSMGEWMTPSEARKLRDRLTKILLHIEEKH